MTSHKNGNLSLFGYFLFFPFLSSMGLLSVLVLNRNPDANAMHHIIIEGTSIEYIYIPLRQRLGQCKIVYHYHLNKYWFSNDFLHVVQWDCLHCIFGTYSSHSLSFSCWMDEVRHTHHSFLSKSMDQFQ